MLRNYPRELDNLIPYPCVKENIDRCIGFQFYLKLPLVFPFDYLTEDTMRLSESSVFSVTMYKI